MAALVSASSTTKEESVGFAVHLHLILQLHHDLAGFQWLWYDQEYRERAAARSIKKLGSWTWPFMVAVYLPNSLQLLSSSRHIKEWTKGQKEKDQQETYVAIIGTLMVTATRHLATSVTAVCIVGKDTKQLVKIAKWHDYSTLIWLYAAFMICIWFSFCIFLEIFVIEKKREYIWCDMFIPIRTTPTPTHACMHACMHTHAHTQHMYRASHTSITGRPHIHRSQAEVNPILYTRPQKFCHLHHSWCDSWLIDLSLP